MLKQLLEYLEEESNPKLTNLLPLNSPDYFPIVVKPNKYGYVMLGFDSFHDWYKKNKGKFKDKAKARKVMERTMELIWKAMITDYWVFKMPHRLGSIYILENAHFKSKSFKKWQASRAANKIVRGYNFNLDGKKPYIKWRKGEAYNASYYAYYAYRGDKKSLMGYRGLWGYINSLEHKVYRPNII